MASNPITAGKPQRGSASPTDPQECCDWANDRLHVKAIEAGLEWRVTGDRAKPIALVKVR